MPTDDENMNAPPPRTLPSIVRTYNGVTTLDNGQQYTHPPVGGFPNAHLTESVWRNTTDFSRLENKAEPGPKAWARPYRGSALQDLQATCATLTAVIRKLTGHPNIKAIAPVPKAKLDERYPPPYHYLIVDGDALAIDRLVRMGTWATPDATFLTENFDVPLSSYLVTLEGFTGPDCTETNDAIASAISAKLLSLQPIVDFLVQNSETAASYTGNIAHDVINSISVYSLRMAKSKTEFYYVWNVYAHPPQMTRENWMIFNGMVRSHNFEVRRLGLGTPRVGENQFKCTGCKSSDHPTGLCPLPAIPGWFGPALSSIADDDKTLSTSDNNHHLSGPPAARGNGRSRGRGDSRTRGWGSRIFRPY
ncbi:hypothetical protein B0H11DRAFT_841536 [Mycena galericulata]|nr:hypothetical protein B0H11DRAFT_841536 [Mycena galericulata]